MASYLSKIGILNLINSSRNVIILYLILVGWMLRKGKKTIREVKALAVFSLYVCSVIFFMHDSKTASWTILILSFLLIPLMFYITSNIHWNEIDVKYNGFVWTIVCNILALIYITSYPLLVLLIDEPDQRVAAYNSIYFVLSTYPFVFLIKDWRIVVLLSLLPFSSFFISGKTTCLLAGALALGIYMISLFKNRKNGILIGGIIVIGLIIASLQFDTAELVASVNEDFDTGGNGRMDIGSVVLSRLFEPTFFDFVVGHGADAVSKMLEIGAHNDFLEVLYNYGLIGLSLYIWFCYLLYRKMLLLPKGSTIRLTYLISLMIFLCASLASKLLGTQVQMLTFALIWGILNRQQIVPSSNKK